MEILAKMLKNNKYKTYYLYSRFDKKLQAKNEKKAKNYGFKGVVYHPIIYITDGDMEIYDELYQS